MSRRRKVNCGICKSFLHSTIEHIKGEAKQKEAERKLVLERLKKIPENAKLCDV